MILLITGKPGSGKTTLLKLVINNLPEAVGFYTEEIRKDGKRIGFDMITSWGERLKLARVGVDTKHKVGRYGVFVENVDRVTYELEKHTKDAKCVFIDEAGKMEFFSERFRSFIGKILTDKDKSYIITVPVKNFHHLIRKLKEKAYYIINAEDYWDKKTEAAMKLRFYTSMFN